MPVLTTTHMVVVIILRMKAAAVVVRMLCFVNVDFGAHVVIVFACVVVGVVTGVVVVSIGLLRLWLFVIVGVVGVSVVFSGVGDGWW
jgi:hypothetical protein